jgi:hypothetical protein
MGSLFALTFKYTGHNAKPLSIRLLFSLLFCAAIKFLGQGRSNPGGLTISPPALRFFNHSQTLVSERQPAKMRST